MRWRWRPRRGQPGGASTHLVVDEVCDGVAHGWACGAHPATLALRLEGVVICEWPRTVPRPDADAAVGEHTIVKGFAVPVGPLAGLLALTPGGRRPAAALTFGDRRVAIAPAAPGRVLECLGRSVDDLWLCDSRHLRLRTAGGIDEARLVQVRAEAAPFVAMAPVPVRPAVVTLPLVDPMAPLLLLLRTGESLHIDLLPFPSLLRGGVHAAETLATAGDTDGLARRSAALAAAFAARTRRRPVVLPHAPSGPLLDPAVRGFLSDHAALHRPGTDVPADALPLGPDEIPTVAALCGPAGGLIAVDPAPGGQSWLVDVVTDARLHAAVSPGEPAPRESGDAARQDESEGAQPPSGGSPWGPGRTAGGGRAPAVLRLAASEDRGFDALLFPLAPDEPFAPAAPFHTALLPGGGAVDDDLAAILPRPVVDLSQGPTTLAALAVDDRPVLFLDRAVTVHDPRALVALTRLVEVPDVASAGCMVLSEPAAADRSVRDRVRSAGLFPTHAAVDAPWRPAVGPVPAAAALLERSVYVVAANDPACVMVAAHALRAHGGDLSPAAPDALAHVAARAAAAGLRHVCTTWFSVFDRGATPRPGLAPAFESTPREGVSLLRRLT